MRVDVVRLARLALVPVVIGLSVSLAPASVASRPSSSGFEGIRLQDVAGRLGLDFRQGAFRFGVSPDPAAMTGGGRCALDYNNDGWADLFVVNSYSQANVDRWQKHGGLPRTALVRDTGGRFRHVTRTAGAGLAV